MAVITTTDALFEYYDMTHTPTRRHILALDEAGKEEMAAQLAGKLYTFIVNKVEDIDYGTIPASKGDITKVGNFDEMRECLTTIREVLVHFNQNTSQVDTLDKAISNMEDSKKIWEKAFAIKSELPCVFYNNMVLAIIAGVSLMIQASIEFIKDNETKTIEISFDKAGYVKTKDKLLFKNIEKFNKAYAKGDVNKLMMALNKSQQNMDENALYGGEIDYQNESSALALALATITITPALLTALLFAIPVLHVLVSIFYEAKQSVSDYFAIQHQIVVFNAEKLKYDYTKSDKEVKKIYDKQMKIADKFRAISNAFAIKMTKAEKEAEKNIDKELKAKIQIPEEDTEPSSSSIF